MALSLRRSYVDNRVFIALAGLALFSVISTIVTIFGVQKMLEARQAGLADSNARTALQALTNEITAAESSQRGYILTGDESYLAPYTTAQSQIPGQLIALKKAVAITPYDSDVVRLTPIVQAKLAELAKTIETNKTGGMAAATAIIATGHGQALMNQITSNIGVISTKLNADIAATRTAVNHYAGLARNVGLLSLLGTLVVVVGVYYLFDHAIEAERKLDRAKDEFVALASHQLRTPATGIKSILSMLGAGDFGPLTEPQARVVGKAILSNERELSIIEELLNVAKADAGRLVLKPTQLDMSALIEQIVSEQKMAIDSKQQILKFKSPSGPLVITADEEKLYMAISNLLDNARKYTPEQGRIWITLGQKRGHISVEVADSGIGIDENELDHIFDRFQRSRLVLAGTIEGTGLGLYLARHVAELHHGTINVDSKKGQGSRFILVLPKQETV